MSDDELSRLRETDNGPKPEDGPQDGVPQDPESRMIGDAPPGEDPGPGGVLSKLFSKKVSPEAVLKVCRSQLGQGEHPGGSNHNKYTTWYGIGDGPWCDMFQGWCDDQAAGDGWLKKAGRFAYTPSHAEFYRKEDRWGHRPRVGALAFYCWSGSKEISKIEHIERVEAVNADGSFYALGGNVSNAVRRTRRSMRFVVGFGYPPYNASGGGADPGPNPWPGRYLQLTKPLQTGSDVEFVQKRLNAKADAGLDADGAYGPKTEAAVKAYQKAHDLDTDGVVGPKTWASLAG